MADNLLLQQMFFCLFSFLKATHRDTVHFEGGHNTFFSHSCLLHSATLSDPPLLSLRPLLHFLLLNES